MHRAPRAVANLAPEDKDGHDDQDVATATAEAAPLIGEQVEVDDTAEMADAGGDEPIEPVAPPPADDVEEEQVRHVCAPASGTLAGHFV
jgi:hypothetical protein